MDQFEMQQALKIAQNREQSQQGAVLLSFILTSVFAWYSPDWVWFHGKDIGWSNVILFFAIDLAITFVMWWMIDKTTVDKKIDQP